MSMYQLVLMQCWSAKLQEPLPLSCTGSKVGQGRPDAFFPQYSRRRINRSLPSMYVPRGVRGGVHTVCWARCPPRDPSHSKGAKGGCWPVHLCGQQPCWNCYWYNQPQGRRWVGTSACPHRADTTFRLRTKSDFLLLSQRPHCSLRRQPTWWLR